MSLNVLLTFPCVVQQTHNKRQHYWSGEGQYAGRSKTRIFLHFRAIPSPEAVDVATWRLCAFLAEVISNIWVNNVDRTSGRTMTWCDIYYRYLLYTLPMFGCWSFRQILASRSNFWKSIIFFTMRREGEIEDWHVSVEWSFLLHCNPFNPLCISPREVNFFVFMIFAANSRLVDFWTHLLTIENAPLWEEKKAQLNRWK